METVLIVEDDPALLRGLTDNLRHAGYSVLAAEDGERGIDTALAKKPDLILLDLMLPKVNGYEVCRYLREEGIEAPILMLTAKGETNDIVLGLKTGADDYITKPFDIREVMARIEASLRRRKNGKETVFVFGGFRFDVDALLLEREGSEVPLTPKEFGVLHHLIEREGRAVSREDLLESVWGSEVFVTGRSVDRCVNTLRQKLENDPKNPRWIRTVREVGYRFERGGT